MSREELPCNIPKIIHQTWKTDVVPDHWKPSMDAWKKYHPDWEYKLWTDEDNRAFVAEKFPWFLETFDSFPYGIQRADAIRYCILYVYGGVYCDLDLEPLGNLENLFPNKGVYLVPSSNTPSCYTNSFMASSPNNPFWVEVLLEIGKKKKWWVVGKHLEVMSTTGPQMIDRVAKKASFTINILPYTVILSCSICEPQPCRNKFSRLRILKGESWTSYDTAIYNFFLCNPKKIFIGIILFIILYKIYRK